MPSDPRQDAIEALAEAAAFALEDTNETQAPWWYQLDAALAHYKMHSARATETPDTTGLRDDGWCECGHPSHVESCKWLVGPQLDPRRCGHVATPPAPSDPA